ncbi:hypothetical protein D9757_006304 [Collybiopsis confluens]|uniref:Zn(2)-C6 fungal-type domain-containing protein n=1 Tax=Collybiopsis confluens TaxID=2823264 RepID=A0A8H5M6X6_9AGAR|nr:hypothetical protein D9757_006304 [Collybiopsis confluens]
MTSKGPPSKRTAKALSVSQQKAVEEKRLRGELSCAECRRLKLRCDRLIPCGSCSRRGCASICPSGVLEAGAGHVHQGGMRVGQLRTKISIMAGRIRELEAALGEGHSLLEDRLLRIGRIDEEPPEEPPTTGISQLDGLGTLTLGENGEASYFGTSGGNESLIAREMMNVSNEEEDDGDSDESILDPSTEFVAAMVGPVTDEPFAFPPEDEARELAVAYCDTGALFFRAWKRQELINEVLPKVYSPAGASSHLQSALLFAFALGTYLNPKIRNGEHETQAENWFRRGRVAFQSKSKKQNSPEDTIRALALMGTYFSMASRHHTRDNAWAALALAAKLCQGAGLHRDPARWDLPSALVQRRRSLFWEVYQSDISHSVALGRPPTTPLAFVDCEYPDADTDIHDITLLKYKYSKDAFIPIMELTLSAHPSKRTYRDVLELDAKIRRLQDPLTSSNNALGTFYASQYFNAVVLTLHRSYMARAILNGNEAAAEDGNNPKKPFDPFDSAQTPYAPSVNAAYHAAQEIAQALHGFCATDFEIAGRVWFLTYHGFSAALCLGAIASRAPGSPFAPSALMTLSLIVDGVFAKYVGLSTRHRTAFLILRKLKTRAVRRYTAFLESKAEANDGERAAAGKAGDGASASGPRSGGTKGGSRIGLGPGAVDLNDPTLHIKLDSDPESDYEDGSPKKRKGSTKPDPSETFATFEGKIAMFGGKTTVVHRPAGKRGKKKKKNAVGGVSTSASPESTADSPESTTSVTTGSSHDAPLSAPDLGTGASSSKHPYLNMTLSTSPTTLYNPQRIPGSDNNPPRSNDVLMSDIDIRQLGVDSLDGMEGIENFNVDAFGFGFDNFGTDAGSGIVMGMALEDIGMGANMGTLGDLQTTLSSSSAASYSRGAGIGTQPKTREESAFSAYQQQYGFPERSSLSPETSTTTSPAQQHQQIPVQQPVEGRALEEDKEPLTATAQAARMFGMGWMTFGGGSAHNSNLNTTFPLNKPSPHQQQHVPPSVVQSLHRQGVGTQSFNPFSIIPSNSTTPGSNPSSDSTPSPSSYSLSNSTAQSPVSSVSSPSTTSRPGLIEDPVQLYARFAEFVSRKSASPSQQAAIINQLQQDQPYPGSSFSNGYEFANNDFTSANESSDNQSNQDLESFFRSLNAVPAGNGMGMSAGGGTGGGGYVLPFGQVYGQQWQNPSQGGTS